MSIYVSLIKHTYYDKNLLNTKSSGSKHFQNIMFRFDDSTGNNCTHTEQKYHWNIVCMSDKLVQFTDNKKLKLKECH